MSRLIKTVGDDQQAMIADILKLHCPAGIDLDPTYSKGVFYGDGRVPQPNTKSDLFPQTEDTIKCAAENLTFAKDSSVKSIMFDPPFVAGHTKSKPTGVIGTRFHGFPYVKDLWAWYELCFQEFDRVLEWGGVLIVKCQDTVSSGKQHLSHVFVINALESLGFYTKDFFILTAKNRLIGHNHSNQKHARKFHCYFIVFEKRGLI